LSIEARIAALVADFTPSVDELERVFVRHATSYFGCDAAYFATIGPRFIDSSPRYMQRILVDPQRYDPGHRKSAEIAVRYGRAFIDTVAYTPREQDHSPLFRELLQPEGISSVILATVSVGTQATGLLHLVRSGGQFRQPALDQGRPLLDAIAILHRAAVGVSTDDRRLEQLTKREHQVGALAADGFTAVQIAAQLGTSSNTVRRQLEAIYRKCGIGSRAELATLFTRSRFGDRSPTTLNMIRLLRSVQLHA
jgi:DNA-binding CsgD family transcriptional regulator